MLNVEINALMSVRMNKKTNELERTISKEYYDYIQQKVLVFDKEIYRVFYEEIPSDSPDRDELLERIEDEGVQLWTYKSEFKVLQNPLIMNAEAYKSLSYREKVERKIAEHNILDTGIKAIMTRRKSKTISEFEAKLLTAREYELKGLILACIKEIWRLDWDVIPDNAPDRKELYEKIEAINVTKEKFDLIYNSRKKCEEKTCFN